ncbi:Alpha/beta hydrolase family protein [Friedmanniella luteola]|uniref:Alpha/beta hydrolase family protein n=1 Tax=Friedmanniella luteola TaxID=546871 RepID=A0A1H1TL69_9ACTN|nr:alpha/beta fold hydrolase [Friedmanniella luteola]SDS60716.1 Alpha/beta hydrolase family protein [Friedmanniella luteola]
MDEPPPPTVRQKLGGWFLDYGYVAYWTARGVVGGRPDQRLHPAGQPRSPVLLIPGVFESWRFMQPVAEHLYRRGHPVHVLDQLGWNTRAIPELAAVVSDHLEREDLHDVTVVAHSKGGLIAKQALGHPGTLARVRHLVAVGTPFTGSRYASPFLLPSVRMFAPDGPVIRALSLETTVNRRITSLYSVFDPHIPETGRLDGAENVVLPTVGHVRPLGDPRTLSLITDVLERPPPPAETDQPGSPGA